MLCAIFAQVRFELTAVFCLQDSRHLQSGALLAKREDAQDASPLDLSEMSMCSRQVPQGSPSLAISSEQIPVGMQAATMVKLSISQALQCGASEGCRP